MSGNERPTRRRVLAGGVLAGSAFLAGCTSGTGDSDDADGGSEGTDGGGDEPTETDGGGTVESETEAETDPATPYSVEMQPVGEVTFESIPETWVPYTGDYADMGVALGRADGLLAIGIRDRFASHHYDELPGVSVDEDDLTELWQGSTEKEVFYELDADVHVIDPNFMINRLGWEEDDVDEIDRNVAPFVGNTIFSGSYEWHDYEHYSLYEAFEKVAEVFGERDRYEAFERLHEEVLADVTARLPDDRPDVAVLFPESVPPEAFYPYVIEEGTQSKQWTDLGVGRALAESDVADFHETRGTIDYETLLEVDPDVIAVRQQGAVTEETFERDVRSHMRNHDVASDLRAVRNDRVIYGGMTYQGPIINLFQLEQAARDLYPDVFGGEELFDRQRVADIVLGEF